MMINRSKQKVISETKIAFDESSSICSAPSSEWNPSKNLYNRMLTSDKKSKLFTRVIAEKCFFERT